MRAHIRIFLAFRICLNFYPILKIEPARPNLPPKTWGQVQGKKLSIFAIFCGSQPDTFYILSICDQKESSEPILPLWGHERPLTRLSKDTLTFDLGPTVWAHKAGAFSALKLYSGRKYIFGTIALSYAVGIVMRNSPICTINVCPIWLEKCYAQKCLYQCVLSKL